MIDNNKRFIHFTNQIIFHVTYLYHQYIYSIFINKIYSIILYYN